jgi:hypothetical protein
VYLSTNPVQHQRAKHVEIDLHFVRDRVAIGDVRFSMSRPPLSLLTSSPRVFLPGPSRSSGGGHVCEFLSLLASLVHRCAGSPDCGGVSVYM